MQDATKMPVRAAAIQAKRGLINLFRPLEGYKRAHTTNAGAQIPIIIWMYLGTCNQITLRLTLKPGDRRDVSESFCKKAWPSLSFRNLFLFLGSQRCVYDLG